MAELVDAVALGATAFGVQVRVLSPAPESRRRTGRKSLSDLSGLKENRLLARVIDPPSRPFPFDNGRFVTGKPPFSVAEEMELFAAEQVDCGLVPCAPATTGAQRDLAGAYTPHQLSDSKFL